MTFRLPLIALGTLAVSLLTARAQLDVRLDMAKTTYLLFEPIEATVTVSNRAARDVVIGGPGGGSWLTFTITDDRGVMLPNTTERGVERQPFVLKAGETVTENVVLNRYFPLANRGNYTINASAFFPPLQRYASSRMRRFSISEGRVVWERTFGLPQAEGGGFRRFQVLTYTGDETTQLFVRIRDEATGTVLRTTNAGRIILQKAPQVTMDGESNLHILMLGAPRTYGHIVIDRNGRLAEQEQFQELPGDRPTLMEDTDGTVIVEGGSLMAPGESVSDGAPRPAGVRRSSERPSGWFGQ